MRGTLKRSKVIHKRTVGEAFVNPYNPEILGTWKANMDIQFVLDTYACAKYCVGYMMKGNGGISKTLRQINHAVSSSNDEIFNKLQKSAKLLWTGTEISAQEAAGFLLGMKNTDSSRVDIFVNTSLPEERTHILKPIEELRKLDDDAENVVASGVIDHYINRPLELEELCLAEIATMYEFTTKKKKKSPSNEETSPPEDLNFERANQEPDDNEGGNEFELLDGSGYFRERRVRKILRFRHFNERKDPDNYWRERLMLFFPWRNEETDIITLTLAQKKTKANEHHDIIMENAQPYFGDDIDEDAIRALVDDQISDEEDEAGDQIDEQLREQIQEQISEAERALGFDGKTAEKVLQFLPPKQKSQEEYLRIMRSLNQKQRRIVLEVLHRLKCSDDAFHIFLSGGAGVGKSLTITALVQSILRLYGEDLTRDQSQTSVVVSAFTGKAAFNVYGMTLHCTYRFPPNQELMELEASSANSLRVKLSGVKLFVIDEISMTSLYHLMLIDLRLRQIFYSNKPFGGKSILVVGHMRQLPPIGGKFVFARTNGQINPLWDLFQIYELDEIMRQRGEFEFCKALNAMSECIMDDADIALIKSREMTPVLQPPDDAIWLFKLNNQCEKHNEFIHSTMDTQGLVSIARDRAEGSKEKHKSFVVKYNCFIMTVKR